MPLNTVTLLPGVNTEITPLQGQATIVESQLIRFKSAGATRSQAGLSIPDILPEKLGGWQKFYPLSVNSPIRDLHAWEGINSDTHLAIGALTSLDVITAGVGSDITPRIAQTNPAVDFSTTNGSAAVTIVDAGFATSVYDTINLLTPVAVGGIVLYGPYPVATTISSTSYTITAASPATATVSHGGAVPTYTTANGTPAVTVTLANHGYSVGDTYPAAVATTVGGITIFGAYLVQTVPSSGTLTITAANSATSTATVSENGGNASIVYYVAISPTTPPAGYGVGAYGTGGYGIGVTPTPSPGTPIIVTNWSLDNWGEVLIACPANGPIYTWSPDSGFSNAAIIPTAPLVNGGIFVSIAVQILVAWASSINGVQDPLLVQWSNESDYTNWTPTTIDQAGDFRIPTGSRVVGGRSAAGFNIIWTDLDVWAMDYIQPPLVFGFNNLATNCGLIARHAHCIVNSLVFWMGTNQFFLMTGETVTPIPCAVWDFVFQDLDTSNVDKITCAPSNGFGEVTWFFPSLSGGTGEIDSYVKVNFNNGFVWDFGRLQRTAWIDQSIVGEPIGADANGFVYQHEVSPDADGQPLVSSFQTGFFSITDGDDLIFLDWIIPDFRYGYINSAQTAVIQITLYYCDYPGDTVKVAGPYTVRQATQFVTTRLRGRQVSFQIQSSDLGSFWRYGNLRFRTAPDGKR